MKKSVAEAALEPKVITDGCLDASHNWSYNSPQVRQVCSNFMILTSSSPELGLKPSKLLKVA